MRNDARSFLDRLSADNGLFPGWIKSGDSFTLAIESSLSGKFISLRPRKSMAKSFQHEKPPARINLFLEVQTGDAKEKVELPLRMLVTGDFSGKDSDVSVDDREVININKDNFDRVLKSQDVNMEFDVENKIAGEGDMKVNLAIERMKDFSPDEVVKQIPALSKLMATRKLLNDMKNRLISSSEFRKKMESVVKDEAARNKLLEELKGVIPEASDEGGGEAAEEE